jgi:cyclase
MIQVTKNVYVESKNSSCNLGLVTTTQGVVMIDTPSRPTQAVLWRDEVRKKGELRYLINTEEHPDHCTTSWFFPGVLLSSQETRDKLARTPVAEVMERIKRRNPEGIPLMKDFQLRLADIALTGSMNLYLGGHTFHLFPLPGHSTGGIGVYIPEERVVFATDCVFHEVKTFLQEALPEQWLASLKRIGELDAEIIVPGHGSMCRKPYLKEQAGIIEGWVKAVQAAVDQGIPREEAVGKIACPDPYAVQPDISFTEPQINKMIVHRLYDLYATGNGCDGHSQ